MFNNNKQGYENKKKKQNNTKQRWKQKQIPLQRALSATIGSTRLKVNEIKNQNGNENRN